MDPPENPLARADPWTHLRRFTAARIAIGRTGGSQPTGAILNFRHSHAIARDAVYAAFDAAIVREPLHAAGIHTELLATLATDRRSYLLRPDLGRELDLASSEKLTELGANSGPCDLVIIVSDGLAAAAMQHVAATIVPLIAELREAGWRIGPVMLVPLARVKVQDCIGMLLNARYSLMLLGERPGLGTPDSLGAYFTANPRLECTDADRNCVSNIRPEGIPPAKAASKLAWLLKESARLGLCGVELKDYQPMNAPGVAQQADELIE